MDIFELENNVKANKLSSIYLLYGEEKFLLESIVNKILKQFGEKINGINYIQLDSNSVQNIISDIETPAFGYPSKLIVVKDSQLFKGAAKGRKSTKKVDEEKAKAKAKNEDKELFNKLATYIEENIDMINESVRILFIEDDADKNNLYKVIEKYGVVCKFEKLKSMDLERRIKQICNAYQVNIDGSTLRYFIESCGDSMQDLINEIRKQIEFVGKNGTITKENIDKLAIKQMDSIIFDLTDNLGRKNIKQALTILSNMLYMREPIQKILITLYNHFKKLYITKISIREKRNLAEALNLKPTQMFLTNKYTMQSKYFKEAELRNILQDLIDLDYNSKIGNIDINIGLETVLCKYCS